MKTKHLMLAAGVVVAGALFSSCSLTDYFKKQDAMESDKMMLEDDAVEKDGDAMMKGETVVEDEEARDAMVKDDSTGDAMEKDGDAMEGDAMIKTEVEGDVMVK